MMFRSIIAATILMASSAQAQHKHGVQVTGETGQSQFAAIAEIVSRLRADPSTDWSKTDIDGLREHLVDMDNVTTRSKVETIVEGMTVRFIVTGDLATTDSARRMVTAHAPMLSAETGWQVDVEPETDRVEMRVSVGSDRELAELQGLGFYGILTIGAHHQQHHLMMATGRNPH